MKFSEITIGQRANVKHNITSDDIDKFVDLSGDNNKLHVDKDFASRTDFKVPVVHGMIGASFISTLIGTKLPGDGALWYSQSLEFLRPVRIGDSITVEATVVKKNARENSIELETNIYNQYKQIVTKGISKVILIEEKTIKKSEEDEIKKKVVLVLGSTGGIGSATALKLAKEGFDVIIHYHSNKEKAQLLKNQVEKFGGKAIIVRADLLSAQSIKEMMEEIRRYFDNITALVNTSTLKLPTIYFENLEWSDMQGHIDINVKSLFYILKELLPSMVESHYGKIVLITTQSIETPNTGWLHYITSKAALNGFVKTLALEYAQSGINFNMVSPSMVDTELVADIPQKTKLLTEARTPLRRLCTPEDVADAIAYLTSDSSNFLTGETIRVNGGQVMI